MKKKRNRNVLFAFLLLTIAVALSACSGDKKDDSNSSITIGIPQDIEDSLDPHEVLAAGTKEILFNVYEGLVKPDSEGNLIPAVAGQHEISEDRKTYTFTLREGIKFHDGSLVTVEDIQYSIEKCADIENRNPSIAAFLNVKEVRIKNDTQVEIELFEPDTDFLVNLSTVSAAIIPKNNADSTHNAIGTGPYRYLSRSPQENIKMEAFVDYWGQKAEIQNVTFKICANADTIVMELEGGSIDMFARLTPSQVAALNTENFEVLEGTMNLVQALYLNNAAEPFQDVRVRQALCYAVNKDEVLSFVSDGKGTPIGSSMFPTFGKYYMEELNDAYPQNIEKAKELLSEAGYPDGFSFTIQVPSNYQQHVDTAQVLSEQFKAINVDAQIQLVDWDTWLSEVYSNRNFEATVIGVDAPALTARDLLDRFVSTAGDNFINFSSATYDEAYASACAETDDAKQTEYYKTCQTILSDAAANVYLQDLPEFVALNRKYTGYEFYPLYVCDVAKIRLRE